MQAENLGLAPLGGGGPAAERGDFTLGGRIPINPSGGLQSKGHPLGATGIGQLFELHVTHSHGSFAIRGTRQRPLAWEACRIPDAALAGLREAQAGEAILHVRHRRRQWQRVRTLRVRTIACRLRPAERTHLRRDSRRISRARDRDRRQVLGAPNTDHCPPGRRVARECDDNHGVVDHRGEIHRNPGLFVADGSVLPAAVGGPRHAQQRRGRITSRTESRTAV